MFATLIVCIVIFLAASVSILADSPPTREELFALYSEHMQTSPELKAHITRFVDNVMALKNLKSLSMESSSNENRKDWSSTTDSVTTGYSVQLTMDATTQCTTAGPTAQYIVGQGLGVCSFWSESGNSVVYADNTCNINTSADTVALVTNQYNGDATCSGSPSKTQTGAYYPECVAGSSTASSYFVQCPSSPTAYTDYPGYVCIYWANSGSCSTSVSAGSFTTTPNGQCINGAQVTFNSSANTQTTNYYNTTGCTGTPYNSKTTNLPSTKCEVSSPSYSSQCYIVA